MPEAAGLTRKFFWCRTALSDCRETGTSKGLVCDVPKDISNASALMGLGVRTQKLGQQLGKSNREL
jgi:hypothetical protein